MKRAGGAGLVDRHSALGIRVHSPVIDFASTYENISLLARYVQPRRSAMLPAAEYAACRLQGPGGFANAPAFIDRSLLG